MAKIDEPMGEVDESMVEKILELFQSNSVAVDYGTDPNGWVQENLAEGVEAADVARCMPEVTERLGGPYQANAARYNAYHGSTGSPASHSVVNELSYTYNTIYQQNTYIYAEEGSQVVNIQGDGNHVTQTDIDVDFDVDTGRYETGEDGYEHGEDGYEGAEDPVYQDEPVDDDTDDTDTGDEAETGEDGSQDPATGEEPDPVDPVDQGQDGWEDPTNGETGPDGWEEPTDPGPDNPFDDPAGEPAGDVAEEVAEAAEML